MSREFSYQITQPVAVLGKSSDGRYTTEVNYISYNGNRPKLDIRKWDRENNIITSFTLPTNNITNEIAKTRGHIAIPQTGIPFISYSEFEEDNNSEYQTESDQSFAGLFLGQFHDNGILGSLALSFFFLGSIG